MEFQASDVFVRGAVTFDLEFDSAQYHSCNAEDNAIGRAMLCHGEMRCIVLASLTAIVCAIPLTTDLYECCL